MDKVWVQILVKLKGVAYPGDWLEVSRRQAYLWLTAGTCDIPKPEIKQSVQDLFNCAIALSGDNIDKVRAILEQYYPGVETTTEKGFVSSRMLFWDTSANLKPELILAGFELLSKGWQIALPLVDYDLLARDIGSAQDKAQTEAVLHDLRVPVYETRVMFARRCSVVEELFGVWQSEEGDERLAFLRALHQTVPIVNALPPFWIEG